MYSVDASALIYGWNEHYPPDVFPTVWDHLGSLAIAGRLLVSDEIAEELRRKDDNLYNWLRGFPTAVVPLDGPIQQQVRTILSSHQRLLDTRKNKSGGDPFVIALAQVRNATVVTAELATNSLTRPKIPDVCAAIGVRCINLVDLFRAEHFVVR
jgi:hypothetical protein